MTLLNTGNVIVTVPLNKRLAQAGICARRKAVSLVMDGQVKVNGVVVKNPGFRVAQSDVVMYKTQKVQTERPVYCIINKPRGTITTTEDEKDRKTVIDLLPPTLRSRIYPVGRLDKDTTGLLLLTNDGFLAQKLAHPRNKIQKTYHVTLSRPIMRDAIARIRAGVYLEDGKVRVDDISYIDRNDLSKVRVILHSGKNKIVRRLFRECGFWVKKLHRPLYAGLNVKGLALGEWRKLSEREVAFLQKQIREPQPNLSPKTPCSSTTA